VHVLQAPTPPCTWQRAAQAPKKKVAAAPLATKKVVKKETNPLYEKRPRTFGERMIWAASSANAVCAGVLCLAGCRFVVAGSVPTTAVLLSHFKLLSCGE
jgi:hypothetical protein